MSAAANSSSVSFHPSQNSPRTPRSRHPRKSPAGQGGVSSPSDISPPPMSGVVDQEQFLTSDFLPANAMAAAEDGGGLSGEDVELENSDGGAAAKKPAWKVPSNGPAAEVGVVMGAESWPALSESARASPRSPLKAPSHGSVTVPQELPVISLPSPKEVSTSISSPNMHPNNVVPSRHKPMKRAGGNSSHNNISVNDSLPQPPSVQQGVAVDPVPSNASKIGGSGGEHSRDNPNKDGGQRGGNYVGHDSQNQRPYRRSNSGPLTRGDGSHHGRRDHGKQDWGNRSFGSRESHGQRVGSRQFMRGPAPSPAFIPPPSVAVRPPFVAPMYTEMPSTLYYVTGPHPDSLRSMPMVPIQSMYYPMIDPHLPSKIVNQIEYYFSNENLVKDLFLRKNMDAAEGWVPIKLIAGFKKMMELTDNIQLILDAVKVSNMVEVQGDKVRRKGDWNKWIMPSLASTVTSPQSINRANQNMLSAHLNNLALDEKAAT